MLTCLSLCPHRVGQKTQVLGVDARTGRLICEQDLIVTTRSHQRVLDSAAGVIATETKEQLWKMFKRNVALKLRVKLDKRNAGLDTSAWL